MRGALAGACLAALAAAGACSNPTPEECFTDSDCAKGYTCSGGKCVSPSASGAGGASAGSSGTSTGPCATQAPLANRAQTCGIFPSEMCGTTGESNACCCNPSMGMSAQCLMQAGSVPTQCGSYCIPAGATQCGFLPDDLLAYCESGACVPIGQSFGCCSQGQACTSICSPSGGSGGSAGSAGSASSSGSGPADAGVPVTDGG